MDFSVIVKTPQTKKPFTFPKRKTQKPEVYDKNNLAVTSKGHSKIRACCVRDGNSA